MEGHETKATILHYRSGGRDDEANVMIDAGHTILRKNREAIPIQCDRWPLFVFNRCREDGRVLKMEIGLGKRNERELMVRFGYHRRMVESDG